MSSTWNDFSKLLLIREYLMRPYLYDSGHYSRIKRQQGIAEIADVLNSNGKNFTATQIFAQLRYLKATYKKHLFKMEQDRLDGKPVSVPSWKFFNHLRFLGELDATAANHTLATRIYPSPTAGRSRAAGQRRAKSVLQPTVGRPLGNWIAKSEAVTSLLNEPEAYFPQSEATRAVSCTTQPDTEFELPQSVQNNKTGIKIETVALVFGHGFGLTFQDQKMAQFRRCTVSLNHASANDDDSTIEGDGDEVSDVAVAGDPDEDQYFKNFEPESPQLAEDNKNSIKIEAVAQFSNYDYTLENSAFGHSYELTPQDQKMTQLPRCTVSMNPFPENDDHSTIEREADHEANDVAVVDDPDNDQDFNRFGTFVTKTLKRLATQFEPNAAKRARTDIKNMLFHVEFVRMRSDYASA